MAKFGQNGDKHGLMEQGDQAGGPEPTGQR
jgi:hypothetical protein